MGICGKADGNRVDVYLITGIAIVCIIILVIMAEYNNNNVFVPLYMDNSADSNVDNNSDGNNNSIQHSPDNSTTIRKLTRSNSPSTSTNNVNSQHRNHKENQPYKFTPKIYKDDTQDTIITNKLNPIIAPIVAPIVSAWSHGAMPITHRTYGLSLQPVLGYGVTNFTQGDPYIGLKLIYYKRYGVHIGFTRKLTGGGICINIKGFVPLIQNTNVVIMYGRMHNGNGNGIFTGLGVEL